MNDTRLVGLTYQDHLLEYEDNYRSDGGSICMSDIENHVSLLVFSKIKLTRTDETQKLLAFGERLIQELTIVYNENQALIKV